MKAENNKSSKRIKTDLSAYPRSRSISWKFESGKPRTHMMKLNRGLLDISKVSEIVTSRKKKQVLKQSKQIN